MDIPTQDLHRNAARMGVPLGRIAQFFSNFGSPTLFHTFRDTFSLAASLLPVLERVFDQPLFEQTYGQLAGLLVAIEFCRIEFLRQKSQLCRIELPLIRLLNQSLVLNQIPQCRDRNASLSTDLGINRTQNGEVIHMSSISRPIGILPSVNEINRSRTAPVRSGRA